MRRHYLDNIRWITVGLVVLYHVIFMYNGVVTAGVIGPFWEVQYQDAVQYLLYPWFMVLLFLVSGMCADIIWKDIATGNFLREERESFWCPRRSVCLCSGGYRGISTWHSAMCLTSRGRKCRRRPGI